MRPEIKQQVNAWFLLHHDNILIDPMGKSLKVYATGATLTAQSVTPQTIANAKAEGKVSELGSVNACTALEALAGTYIMLVDTANTSSKDYVVVK